MYVDNQLPPTIWDGLYMFIPPMYGDSWMAYYWIYHIHNYHELYEYVINYPVITSISYQLTIYNI